MDGPSRETIVMPVELLESVTTQAQSGALDWRKMRDQIHEAHEMARSTADRVLCLNLHKTVMDAVERQQLVEPHNLDEFRKARRQDYNLLLIKEVMIGRTDGNVDPVRMAEITRREVAAGRMAADDEMHEIAVAGAAVLGPIAPPVKKRGIFSRLFSNDKS
jgi:hypothetical protein